MAIMTDVTNIIAESTKIVTDQKDRFLQEHEVATAINDIKIELMKKVHVGIDVTKEPGQTRITAVLIVRGKVLDENL